MSLSTRIETPLAVYDQPLGLYINGKWVKSQAEGTFDTINPTNEKVIAAVYEAGPEGRYSTFTYIEVMSIALRLISLLV